MNISKKHHYLPVFYLGGFVNKDGEFAVYDYKKTRIKNGLHSPSSHFFIENRNTVTFDEKNTVLLEDAYSGIDNRHSKILQIIANQNCPPILDDVSKIHLLHFMSNLFWRLPCNDELYEAESKNNPLFKGGPKIFNSNNEEIINADSIKLLSSEEFRTLIRWTASDVSLLSNSELIEKGGWEIAYKTDEVRVCSDNPFVFRNENERNIFTSDFIFPISKHHLLIRTLELLTIKELHPSFNVYLDMLIFKQGSTYCCSSNKEYLEIIAENSRKFTTEQLRNIIFEYID